MYDMWQHHLDALLDVQPTLKEALAERGLSETAVFLETDGGGGGAGQGEGDRVDGWMGGPGNGIGAVPPGMLVLLQREHVVM